MLVHYHLTEKRTYLVTLLSLGKYNLITIVVSYMYEVTKCWVLYYKSLWGVVTFYPHLTDKNAVACSRNSLPRVLHQQSQGARAWTFIIRSLPSLSPPWGVCTLNETRYLTFEWCFSFLVKPSGWSANLSFLAAQLGISLSLAVEGAKGILQTW